MEGVIMKATVYFGGGGGLPDGYELFKTSGTFTPGTGIAQVWVTLVGGGCGGDGGSNGGLTSFGSLTVAGGVSSGTDYFVGNNGGGGIVTGTHPGGSGEMLSDVPVTVTPSVGVTVTVGAGGAAGGAAGGGDGGDGAVIVRWYTV